MLLPRGIDASFRVEVSSEALSHIFLCWAIPKISCRSDPYRAVLFSSSHTQSVPFTQAITKLYEEQGKYLDVEHISILLEMISAIATHASEVSSDSLLQMKFHKACSLLEASEPAVVHFENETYQSYLKLLQALLHGYPFLSEDMQIESRILDACEKILRTYLKCAGHGQSDEASDSDPALHRVVPLGVAKKEELAARTPLVLVVMQLLRNLEKNSFRRVLPRFFPLLVDLIRCEHSSGDVQHALYTIFRSSIGPMIEV